MAAPPGYNVADSLLPSAGGTIQAMRGGGDAPPPGYSGSSLITLPPAIEQARIDPFRGGGPKLLPKPANSPPPFWPSGIVTATQEANTKAKKIVTKGKDAAKKIVSTEAAIAAVAATTANAKSVNAKKPSNDNKSAIAAATAAVVAMKKNKKTEEKKEEK